MLPPSAWRYGSRRTTACGNSWSMWPPISTTAAATATATGWRRRPAMPLSTALPPSPPPCLPAPTKTTRPLPQPPRPLRSGTASRSSIGISAPISGRATSVPGSWVFICRSTAAASFPSRTAIRRRSTGTRPALPGRCELFQEVIHMKWFYAMSPAQQRDFRKVVCTAAAGAGLVLLIPLLFHAICG